MQGQHLPSNRDHYEPVDVVGQFTLWSCVVDPFLCRSQEAHFYITPSKLFELCNELKLCSCSRYSFDGLFVVSSLYRGQTGFKLFRNGF